MTHTLNSGLGTCRGSHRLLIRPVLAAISLGATPDVINGALKAIHRINRNGDPTDFIATALPLMGSYKGRMFTGYELEAVGSEQVLLQLLNADVLKMMNRRGMLEPMMVKPVLVETGEPGVAFVRNRHVEKLSPGWLRRTERHALKQGKTLGPKAFGKREYAKEDVVSLSYGEALLHVAQRPGTYAGEKIMVSTYGFSTMASPAILPIMPQHPPQVNDAA